MTTRLMQWMPTNSAGDTVTKLRMRLPVTLLAFLSRLPMDRMKLHLT